MKFVLSAVPAAVAVLLSGCGSSPSPAPTDAPVPATTYSLMFDAGSSGSRLRMYKREGPTGVTEEVVPSEADEDGFETKPGISSYAANPQDAGPALQPLLDAAKAYIPEAEQAEAQLWLKSTAGARLVEENTLNALFGAVTTYLKVKENCPFKFIDAEVVTGQEEATYAWLSINSGRDVPAQPGNATEGILEVGGASAQIAFRPEIDVKAGKSFFYADQHRAALHTRSFNRFGLDQMWVRAQEAALEGSVADSQVDFPCLNKDASEPASNNRTLVGTSDAVGCTVIVDRLLGLDMECLMPPCSIVGRYRAPIPADVTFRGLSVFFWNANSLNLLGWNEEKALSPAAYKEGAEAHCGKNKTQALDESPTDNWDYLSKDCLGGLFIHKLLISLGFGETSTQITVSRKINGRSADWTLGAVLFETESMPLSLALNAEEHTSAIGTAVDSTQSGLGLGAAAAAAAGAASLLLAMLFSALVKQRGRHSDDARQLEMERENPLKPAFP